MYHQLLFLLLEIMLKISFEKKDERRQPQHNKRHREELDLKHLVRQPLLDHLMMCLLLVVLSILLHQELLLRDL
jgi:hypothetical protein